MPSLKYRDPKTGLYQPIPVRPVFSPTGRGVPRGGWKPGAALCWEWNSPDSKRWNYVPWAQGRLTTAVQWGPAVWNPIVWDAFSGSAEIINADVQSQFFAPVAGLYEFNCCMQTGYVAGQRLGLRCYLGDNITFAERTTAQLTSNTSVSIACDIQMAQWDNVICDMYAQVTCNNIASGVYCYATLRWVGAY